ncbi:MAG: carboxynorspermidine decarboxylase [Desulfobacterales bacterium]|nr:carboxynorspermidine decarboxylase [Desulfobacterales bacterium]
MKIDFENVPTPCYLVDEAAVEQNLEILARVQEKTGCKILLALKGFAMWRLFPMIRGYLGGVTASSPDEARLGFEEFGGEVHVCAPAFSPDQFEEITGYADHIVFNSFSQWRRFKPVMARAAGHIRCGIRINPEYSEVDTPAYNPCGRHSRLGVTRSQFRENELDGISGLHFHALCEQDSGALERTLQAAEEKFGVFFKKMKWVNFGGGHHITRPGYDVDRLCALITGFMHRYPVQVYLEPGEAVALNAGVLVSSVLDILQNEIDIAILDASASAHMPDVLEMPYRPQIRGAGRPGDFPFTYRLGGPSCLAGDIIGDYSFPEPLTVGSKLVLLDMAHYTMVKNNTFNGIRLPSIGIADSRSGRFRIIHKFGYADYKGRLS